MNLATEPAAVYEVLGSQVTNPKNLPAAVVAATLSIIALVVVVVILGGSA